MMKSISEIQRLLDSLDALVCSLETAVVVSGGLHAVVLHLDVEFNLRLCSRRTHTDLGAVSTEPLQHVACGRHVELLCALGCCNLKSLEVFPYGDRTACEILRRISTEVSHHLLDFVCTSLSWLCDINGELAREAVVNIDVHQQIVESTSVILCPCCNLADKTDRSGSILVAHLVVRQIAE